MNNINTEPAKLVTYIRDGLIEQEHFGYVVRTNKDRVLEKVGDDKNYPFFLRSCAKPLQAALLIDCGLDEKFNLTEEEIAICSASHAGEQIHVDLVKGILNKLGIDENKLKCGNHNPISKTAQENLLINGEKATVLHNNCSGKHAMMLGLCKINDWDMDNYDNINHPLQQAIKKRIYELCDIKTEYPITKDGCGVPIHSMPLANIVKGYLNLFCDPKYEKIKNAFLKHSYTIGGENRTDTKIISATGTLIAKVGASGLCVVLNPEIEEGFIVKVCDSNMEAREIVTVDIINNLHWGNIEISHDIKTVHDEKIGEIITLL
ncbi:asparaginase [bacterium]|nr:asparaginase [bacterium]